MDSNARSREPIDGVVFDPQGRWWRGANLDLSLVRGGFNLGRHVKMMDSTLREGEETPGTHLNREQKLRMARALTEAGFEELEVGYAGVIKEHWELVRELKRAFPSVKLASHTRAYAREGEWQDEIDRAIDAGCDILTFVGFGSEAMLKTVPWLRRDSLAGRFAACIERARSGGVTATFSLAGSDLFRTPLAQIALYYRAAAEAGAARLYVSDGTGVATPESVGFFTRYLQDIAGSGPSIALHLHNTFGLATANAISGVLAGAQVVDTCLLGLGDGAGITAAEELALALAVLYDIPTDLDLEKLGSVCALVKETFAIQLSPNKPHTGENIYRHQLDSHVAAILRTGWHSWEVVRAESLGRERRLELGHGKVRRGRSGTVAALLEQMGLEASDRDLDHINEKIRSVTERKGFASLTEIEHVIREHSMARKRTDAQ